MNASKHIRLNKDAVIEYIYSTENDVMSEDYHIVYYKPLDYYHFSQDTETFGLLSQTNNVYTRQLMNIDTLNNKWAPLEIYNTNIIHRDYSAADLIPYDTIKIYFPAGFSFPDRGFLFRVYLNDYNEAHPVFLSQVYYDKELHNADPLGSLSLDSNIKLFDGVQFIQYYQLKIPSPYFVSRMRNNSNTSNVTIPGSLNWNLNNGVGLSINSPIFFEYSYLTKRVKNNNTYNYYNGSIYRASIPQSSEHQTVGIKIQESTEGDFFEICGIYNDSFSGFADYMQTLENEGKSSYIIYTIIEYQQNIISRTFDVFVGENFSQPYAHRPIFRNTTTTASIDVEMKIISRTDSSMVTKTGSIGLIREQINKYGNKLSKINVTNFYKPKIYNPIPDQIQVMVNEISSGETTIQYSPVFYDRHQIVIKSASSTVDTSGFFSLNQLEIAIYPFENIYQFIIAKNIDTNKIERLNIPSSSDIQLIFKGQINTVQVGVYFDSLENDFPNGVVNFHLDTKKTEAVANMYRNGDRSFMLVSITPNAVDTVIYIGKFILVDSDDFRKRSS